MEIVAHVGIFVRQNLLKLLFFNLKRLIRWNFTRELSLQNTFETWKNLNLKLEKWRHNEVIQFLLIITLRFVNFVIFSELYCQSFKSRTFYVPFEELHTFQKLKLSEA